MPLKIPQRDWFKSATTEIFAPESESAGMVHTTVEYMDPEEKTIGLFPTVRVVDGVRKELPVKKARDIAIENGDFIPVKSFEEGVAMSKQISRMVGIARSPEGYTSRWKNSRKNN
tara:strand:+ start:1067 stop:1411 length:345 start_codon:yes stop_codon:yes gene_type:complete